MKWELPAVTHGFDSLEKVETELRMDERPSVFVYFIKMGLPSLALYFY